MSEPRLVDYDDTMHQLGGISRTTLHGLIVDGKLTRAQIGRRSFVTQESIDAYVDSISSEPALAD
ncbi:MAG: helix-turn-helix domain-containing protein [Actinomycetota bacterium]